MTHSIACLVATFIVPGEPASKSRPRFTTRWGRPQTYTPDATKRAEAGVGAVYLAACGNRPPDERHMFAMDVDFYCATGVRRDVDNMVKLILDSLNKIAWADDHQVVEVHAKKHFIEAVDDARTEVAIHTVGIMPNRKAICQRCGVEFPRPKSHAAKKYCSDACRRQAMQAAKTKTCDQCGATFTSHSPKSQQRFCSSECHYASKQIAAICTACGKQFAKPRHLNRSGNSYCSDECKRGYWRDQRKSAAKGTCQDCGGPTTKKTYKRCRDCLIAAGGRWADRESGS